MRVNEKFMKASLKSYTFADFLVPPFYAFFSETLSTYA